MMDRAAVEAIRQSVSIVSVAVRLGITLKKAGNEWEGLCPFHQEKTPSFKVFNHGNGDRFQCFGCGARGDVVDLVMKVRGLDFKEALAFLGHTDAKPMMKPAAADIYADLQQGSSDVVPKVGEPIRLWNPKRGHHGRFTPEAVYPYPGGYVVRRTSIEGSKETPMIRVSQHGWTRWPFDRPRPLYGRIEGKGKTIVVEGEKCVDALMSKVKSPVVTWPGGTNGLKYADFRSLAKRGVVLWADHDEPGSKAMSQLLGMLAKLECRCTLIDTFECTRSTPKRLGRGRSDRRGW
jgi:5S rRNA maturation endonuclease (ribonuclease M5)